MFKFYYKTDKKVVKVEVGSPYLAAPPRILKLT